MAEEKQDSATLYVKSARGDNRVALFERDPIHPTGEAFVAGHSVVEVGRSAGVGEALHNRQIVEASAADRKAYDQVQAAKRAERVAVMGDVAVAAAEDMELQLAEAQAQTAEANLARAKAELAALTTEGKAVAQANDEAGKTRVANAAAAKTEEIKSLDEEAKSRRKGAADRKKAGK